MTSRAAMAASRALVAPDLGQPLGTPAIPFVVLIAHRIYVVIVLVVALGRVKGRRRPDLGRHRLLEAFGDLLLRLLREIFLFVVRHEHHGAIGRALVAELPAGVE